MKTRRCDECKWYAANLNEHVCRKQHFPRFYMPKGPMDLNYGWKRKCEDFEEAEK